MKGEGGARDGGGAWSPGNGPGDWPADLQLRPMVRRLANARRGDCGCAGDSNRRRLLAGSAGGAAAGSRPLAMDNPENVFQ